MCCFKRFLRNFFRKKKCCGKCGFNRCCLRMKKSYDEIFKMMNPK